MLALAIQGLFTLATAQSAAPDESVVPRGAELDALIARLPRVGCESTQDASTNRWIPLPDVATMQRCVAAHALTDEQWVRALMSTGAVRSRVAWPELRPYAISMCSPQWMGLGRITLKPRIAGWSDATVGDLHYGVVCGNAAMARYEREWYQALGSFRAPTSEVTLDVLVELGHSSMSEWSRLRRDENGKLQIDPPAEEPPADPVLWKGVLRLPVELTVDVDRAVVPVTSSSIESAVSASLGVGWDPVDPVEPREPRPLLTLDPDMARFPVLREVGLSLEVSVLRDGTVMETVRFPASSAERAYAWQSAHGGCDGYFDSKVLSTPPHDVSASELARWTLRVRGTDEGVLALWGCNSRWSGEVVIPLAMAIEQEKARAAKM